MVGRQPNLLQIDVRVGTAETVIYFAGLVTDASQDALHNLVKQVTGTKCRFNLKGIASIDSLGTRGWIQFIREFSPGREVTYEECSPDIVMQINMVPAFLHPATLKSIYTVYQCDECGETRLRLIDLAAMYDANQADLPDEVCTTCKVLMDPDTDGQLCLANYFERRRRHLPQKKAL